MSLSRLPAWALAGAAALALAGAAMAPGAARWPLVAVAGGLGLMVGRRKGGANSSRARIEVLSRVPLTPRSHAALLSVDGAGWLIVVGEGFAQLARAELAGPREPRLVLEDAP